MNNDPDNLSPDINPATGLPMIDDADIDVCGNPYGTDVHTTYDSGPSYYTPLATDFDSW